jgi:hypothetical protein
MEQETRQQLPKNIPNISSLPFLLSPLAIELHERSESIPRIGDLWIPITNVSIHHKIRFFLLGIERLFVVGDKVVRVEHTSEESRISVWRLGKDYEGDWMWNYEHEDKMHYSLL